MIIFLNGASSSGKTAIARALQGAWHRPLLRLGIDTLLGLLPAAYVGSGPCAHEGVEFYQDADDHGPLVRVRSGPIGRKLAESFARVVALLAADDHDLVVDYVLLDTNDLVPYLRELRPFQVYFVAVRCDVGALEARELARGDRLVNLARAQHSAVHDGPRHYDLEVDTTARSPYDLATTIITFVQEHPRPEGFHHLRSELGMAG
jgi:chloramphenicol 3-O phosphotransferase